MIAISGNANLIKSPDAEAAIATEKEALRSLERLSEAEPDEIITIADRFVNIDARTNTANNMPNADNTEVLDLAAEKGILSAESILRATAITPTGTQVISTLNLTANALEVLEPLRHFNISAAHRRLALFAPAVQESFGRKSNGGQPFGGYYSILDPMMLAAYVPYAQELIDLRDEQIEECFHPLQAVDGYPTIQGVPVWERQEWERIEYYNLFKLFRDMRYAFYNESDALVVNRSQAVLARAARVPTSVVSYLSTVYNWQLRVSLYDAWMASMQERRVVVKRQLMLDRHAKISQALINKAFAYLNKASEKMSPKEAIEMLKLGLMYDRISMGLMGDKPETPAQATAYNQPLISVVNQTNNTTGPLQVNNEGRPAQQLQEDLKKPDTLLGILSVLQRSGAFDVMAQKVAAEGDNSASAIDAQCEEVPLNE